MRHSLLALLALSPLLAQEGRLRRYALVLEEAPLAELVQSAKDLRNAAASPGAQRLEASQQRLLAHLQGRGFCVTGRIQTIANAVFVRAREEQLDELRALPGVRFVQEMLPLRRNLTRANELVRAPQAWSVLGGENNAGAGMKIGIIDSGIDHEHPGLRDDSLRPPAGYPLCRGEDCQFTNSKVIVARSYVQQLVLGDVPEDSRPDDLSPRDRVGHGTAAAMIAAGARHASPVGTLAGVAPKAFLGNYKVFGSPGVNDVTFDDVVLTAMDDAFRDQMDVVNLSLGRPAVWGPLDPGSVCNLPGPCDVRADAVQRVVSRGMTVVVSAGNDGDLGLRLPTLNSIHTPGTAPAAITVGASTNAHIFYASVRLEGDVPEQLRRMNTLFGNGPPLAQSLTAPLRDVAGLDDNGLACAPLATGSLAGAIALIQRGDCLPALKVRHAQQAGAVAVLLFQAESNFLFPLQGLVETGIPLALIGARDGRALKTFLASNRDYNVTLDPALTAVSAPPDEVAYFSSQGPGLPETIRQPQNIIIKPELVAVGTDVFTATQRFDPNGDLFNTTGYTSAPGTSFSAPMVAGAAALVKQRNPRFSPAQIKSALVNTADNRLTDFDNNGRGVPARVTAVGAGKLNVEGAVRLIVTADPAAVSFGVIGRASLPVSRQIRFTNGGTANAQLRLSVSSTDRDSNARVVLSANSLAVNAGQTATLIVRLEGTQPSPGSYEGALVVEGAGSPMRIPYLYLVGDGIPYNMFPLRGNNFVGIAGQRLPGRLTFKLTDRFGVPVPNAPVRFRVNVGGGSIDVATETTDELGIAEVSRAFLGPQLGEQEFGVEVGGLRDVFRGRAILRPTIRTHGIVNAASGRSDGGLAPGSYASIFGRGLSESLRAATTASLPLSLARVSVSFDVPARRLSLPGRLHFVSDEQINVQIPWELQGLRSALVKVSLGDFSSGLYDLALADYSPGLFEFTEPSSGRLLAAALDRGFQLISSSNPARRGDIIQLYANGLGPVEGQVRSGEPSPADPLARTRVSPVVTIGGRTAEVLFSGLAPGNVGLYQINVRVPPDAPTGLQPVNVSVGGATARTVNIPVQ